MANSEDASGSLGASTGVLSVFSRRTSFCSSSRSTKSGIVLSYDLLIFRPSSPGMVLSPASSEVTTRGGVSENRSP